MYAIRSYYAPYNAVLMPTGAHPWMNPDTDTVLWPHESNEIYSLYHRIFNCKGHGWSNLQSMHLNLPFSGDVEFHALHSAVRLLLPLMPALTASTPVLDGVETGFVDSRLEHYRFNQQKIPCIAGRIIPEEVASKADYQLTIYNPIAQAIKPYDNQGLLKQHFLNSRGAIARFDRNTIEIRILDLQEAPLVDLALAKFIFEVIRYLVSLRLTQTGHAHSISTDYLADVFEQVIKVGDVVEVLDTNHLLALGFGGADKHTVNEIWMTYFTRVSSSLTPLEIDVVRLVLEQGCLSTRIKKALHLDASLTHQHLIYQQLIQCLVSNKPFVGIG